MWLIFCLIWFSYVRGKKNPHILNMNNNKKILSFILIEKFLFDVSTTASRASLSGEDKDGWHQRSGNTGKIQP